MQRSFVRRIPVERGDWVIVIVIGAGLALAFAGSRSPLLFLGFGGAFLAAVLALLSFHRPAQMMTLAPLMVLVGGTKFRSRDAAASLGGSVDLQVAFELGVFGLLGVMLLGVWARGAVRDLRIGLAEASLLAFVLVCGLSVAWSAAAAMTLVRSVQLLVILALGWTCVGVLGPRASLRSVGFAAASAVLTFSAVAAALPATKVYSEQIRFSWFAVHPITAGSFTAIGLLYLLWRMTDTADGRGAATVRWPLLLLGTASMLPILMLTRSRGAIIAFAAAAAVLLAGRYLNRWQAPILTGLFGAAALVVVNSAMSLDRLFAAGARSGNPLLEILYRGQTQEQILSLTGRTDLWAALLPVIAGRPLLGYGYQGSRGILLDLYSWAGYAHNALLQTVLDTGVLGALLLWVPLLAGLAAALWGAGGAEAGGLAAAVMVFLTLNSIVSESFSGAPGFELLLLFVCILGIWKTGARSGPPTARWSSPMRAPGLSARDAATPVHAEG